MCRISLIVVFLSLVTIGCGGAKDAPRTAPVSGVVKVNGQPVANPVVTFYPEKGPTGIGVGNEEGAFTIKTNGRNGAPVGKCKVTVVGANDAAGEIPPADGNEMEIPEKPRLNSKYASQDTTDLIVDVTEEGNSDLQLDLDN